MRTTAGVYLMDGEPANHPDNAPRIDQFLADLSHYLRREIIRFFENVTDSQTVSLPTLVSHLERRIPNGRSEDLEIQLVHVHLPKLARTGWLDYDRRSDDVRYHGHDHAGTWLTELRAIFVTGSQPDFGTDR